MGIQTEFQNEDRSNKTENHWAWYVSSFLNMVVPPGLRKYAYYIILQMYMYICAHVSVVVVRCYYCLCNLNKNKSGVPRPHTHMQMHLQCILTWHAWIHTSYLHTYLPTHPSTYYSLPYLTLPHPSRVHTLPWASLTIVPPPKKKDKDYCKSNSGNLYDKCRLFCTFFSGESPYPFSIKHLGQSRAESCWRSWRRWPG